MLQRELIDLLGSLPKQLQSEWVFYHANGEPFKQWHIHKPFKEVWSKVEIETKHYSWKELRHTKASLTHRKGVPPLAIKDQLEHSNVKTTVDYYIGSDMSYQREQIEKLILNSGKIVEKGET